MPKYRAMLFTGSMAVCAVLTAAPLRAAPYKAPYDIQIHKIAGGEILTDSKGMTLYTYAKDRKGASTCTDTCVQRWPPLKADAEDKPVGDFTVISRSSGGKQWAYDGKPLYKFKEDAKPGQVKGDGIGGVWHVAKPS